MRFDIITIFPKIFDSYLNESLVKRARVKKIIAVSVWNLRDFANDRHEKVDDRPYGGGPGMVLKVEPIYKAVEAIKKKSRKKKIRVVLFSTRGKKFDAKMAQRLSKYDDLVFICGRYEGVDERAAQYIADEEISIGNFVLSGGELPALTVLEAVSRYIPGFLGKEESLEEIGGSHPSYTRPEIFKLKKGKLSVPKVLLSGNHKEIEAWRRKS